MSSITSWHRIEPRPRSDRFGTNLSAPIRDPLWFLARQWQMGEFRGEDVGSVAYVEHTGRVSTLPRWSLNGEERALDPGIPLERQTLAEPMSPDQAMRVELAQLFGDLLANMVGNATTTGQLMAGFASLSRFALPVLPDSELAPLDADSVRFMLVCSDRALDGYAIYQFAVAVGQGAEPVPSQITTIPSLVALVQAALAAFVGRVDQTYGPLGTVDPETWRPKNLEYDVTVIATDPAGQGNAQLAAVPDRRGLFDWFSFDVTSRDTGASEAAPEVRALTMTPTLVHFQGMPNPRFWRFESNTTSFADLQPSSRDIMKLLVADFMLIHGQNWYTIPLEQPLGSLYKTDALVVYDVFGNAILIERADQADKGAVPPSIDRWTMFSLTDTSGSSESIADCFMLPPSPGPAVQPGVVLEDVRFARDEMANMAWAIERITESAVGEPRSGRQRDGQIAARQGFPPAPSPSTSLPLRYDIQSLTPANWIPLLGVQESPSNPSIVLEKAATIRPTTSGKAAIVPSEGRILNPSSLVGPGGKQLYHIAEEDIPRQGLRLERVLLRTRWYDGSTHLWIERRRLAGAGESQSGLRFDQALPNG